MFTSSNKHSPKLDLDTLESYSPKWSPHLRLALCIATDYAVQRCIQRSEALVPTASAYTSHTQAQAARELAKAWRDYGEKFLTATCQHLGIPQDTLPPHPITLEDVLIASQGRTEQDSLPTHSLPSSYEPQFESGSDHVRRFPHLALPIQGVDDAQSKPNTQQAPVPGDSTSNSRIFSDLDVDLNADRSASDAASETFAYDEDAKELPEFMQRPATATATDSPQDSSLAATATSATKNPQPDHQSPASAPTPPRRVQGVIDAASGQEIEIAHELILVALGLGQFRAQDGSTTLFEQDMLFGHTELDTQPSPPSSPRPKPDKSESDASLNTQTDGLQPQNEALAAVTDASKRIAGVSRSAFSSLKTNTITGWTKVSSASKEMLASTPAGSAPTSVSSESVRKKPVKPNELCHYDARARAIIFVALTAMGVSGKLVWLAEKVMAQTIYFIMTEANRAAASRDGKDLIQSLPSGASLDTRTGSVTQPSDRSAYMNQHSGSVVEREKGKAGWGKWAAMGGGFIAGGLVIGLTGGLAAPLIAPALVGLTGVSFLATSGGIIMLGTLFGLGGGGLAGYKVERRLRGVESFAFTQLQTEAQRAGVAIPSLHATICCSGLLLDETEQVQPWQSIFETTTDGREAFAIQCEAAMMKEAGVGLRAYMIDQLIRSGGTKAAQEVIKRTALTGLAALTLPLTVFNAASATLDGVFVRAKTRSHKAGLILAETLKNEVQGHRPVVLVGTSLGAATILSALVELARDPERNAHLVDSVFLISAPITPSPATMRSVRAVVQRRFVNVFSSNDMVCGIAAWLGSGISVQELREGNMPRVAGSRAIDGVPGLENINVSDIIDSHFEINSPDKLEPVLRRCGLMDD